MPEQRNDLIELIRIALKWKRPIIITTIIAALGSAAFSWFFMPNYYKSSVNFYPANPVMTDRQVLYSNSLGEIEIDYFGGSSDVDRILTLANGTPTIDYIINKYHLMEHYDYDSTKTMARYKTKKKFLKNYKAVETEFGAIEITVWDTDKNLAAEMANHIALTIDNHNRDMLLRDKFIVIETFEDIISDKQHALDQLTDSLETMVNTANAEKIKQMEFNVDAAMNNLAENRKLMEQYVTSTSTKFSTIHITEEAYPAIRKDKPIRSLIVVACTVGAFIFMLLLAVITENYRKIKHKLSNA
ncbi:MAG TPA: Wzz/FepE/Etk N-terminal domain-containing protein [Chitinophagales bacterium]|nr:Wzz/FepE/Etk N-terminal domain-containing protein [Chitinophagales bacterium]